MFFLMRLWLRLRVEFLLRPLARDAEREMAGWSGDGRFMMAVSAQDVSQPTLYTHAR
jgi:hypothetical protein